MTRKKILWLCSWYPNRVEPFSGDFIQRHARAAALYNDIHVIHLAADTSGKTTDKETTIHKDGYLTEQIIYYKKKTTARGRLMAHYRWLFLYRQVLRNYILNNGRPDLLHVQVPVSSGIFGVWMKKKYGIPYVVTEHWGIYNNEVPDRFENRSRTVKFYSKQIFSQAAKFISVSRYLGEGVNRLVLKKDYDVIPNVADTSLFFYIENQPSRFRFIHVSNMVQLKNPEGILRAFSKLYRQNNTAEMVMVGDTDLSIREYAASLKLPDGVITFKGEVPYVQVAKEMQQADCFVLFSNIENSPCVIGEALCCGLPVIATQVGGIPELVDSSNSLLVDPKEEDQLTAVMMQMINSYPKFDRKAIAAKAALRFSYETVGKQFDSVYDSILKSS